MPSRSASPKIGALCPCVSEWTRRGLQQGAVLGHEVQDGMALVGAAGQEAREQRDVGVGHQVVADAAVAAVTDVVRGLQALGMHVPLHPVGGRALAAAPEAVQPDARVGVDHAGDRLVQAGLGHVALVDVRHVPAVQALERARRLARPQAAAVAEGGRHVALARALQLGLEAAHRAEVPGPVQPVLGVGERLQDAGRDHARLEQALEERGAVGRLARPQPLHYGLAVHDLDVLVLREAPVGG